MKIYIGGLPFSVTEEGLQALFTEFGEIASVNLVKDGTTGQSRGFGFVEMPDREAAEKAVAEMAGFEIEGRSITVEQARERVRSNGPRGGRGGRPGHGGGRGGNRRGGRPGGRGRS